MWINQFKAFLDIECKECGGEVEAEIFLKINGYTHDTISVKPCECQEMEHAEKVEAAVELLQEENKDSDGCVVCYHKESGD